MAYSRIYLQKKQIVGREEYKIWEVLFFKYRRIYIHADGNNAVRKEKTLMPGRIPGILE